MSRTKAAVVSADYRRMAASAEAHGRPAFAEHWRARADAIDGGASIVVTDHERAYAIQAQAIQDLAWDEYAGLARRIDTTRRGRQATVWRSTPNWHTARGNRWNPSN